MSIFILNIAGPQRALISVAAILQGPPEAAGKCHDILERRRRSSELRLCQLFIYKADFCDPCNKQTTSPCKDQQSFLPVPTHTAGECLLG